MSPSHAASFPSGLTMLFTFNTPYEVSDGQSGRIAEEPFSTLVIKRNTFASCCGNPSGECQYRSVVWLLVSSSAPPPANGIVTEECRITPEVGECTAKSQCNRYERGGAEAVAGKCRELIRCRPGRTRAGIQMVHVPRSPAHIRSIRLITQKSHPCWFEDMSELIHQLLVPPMSG